jgi:hypothetical protein
MGFLPILELSDVDNIPIFAFLMATYGSHLWTIIPRRAAGVINAKNCIFILIINLNNCPRL